MEKIIVGRAGEAVALEYLSRRGLRLIARNLHLGHVEIDLIMESTLFCHIIEVKTLTDSFRQMPFERVDNEKRRNLIKAARFFVKIAKMEKEIVFDVVSVLIDGGKIHLKYIPDAFSASFY